MSTTPPGGQQLLLVEDETVFARAVAKRLSREGYVCRHAETLAGAREALDELAPDVLLLDMRLPDGSGLELLAELRERRGLDTPVLVLTAYGDLDDAVQVMKLQALDYLKKPVDLNELVLKLDRLRQATAADRSLHSARIREAARNDGTVWIGASSAARAVMQQIEHIGGIAARAGEAPPTVLLTGETGTGKDLAARLLHQVRGLPERPFVQVDCAALPPQLIESELFGHEKGSFTSAGQARMGLIEAAEKGTLFLDEIGELPTELQAKLLAVLERRRLRRVGGNREYPVQAWFVAASNRNLPQMVAAGSFRQDLYYRLDVLGIELPPLRERREDLPLLSAHFANAVARRYGMPTPALTRAARQALGECEWPGNVRELRHWVERAVLMSRDGRIDVDALPARARALDPGAATSDDRFDGLELEQAERLMIERALDRYRGNVSRASRALGVTRMALRYRMDKYGISRPED